MAENHAGEGIWPPFRFHHARTTAATPLTNITSDELNARSHLSGEAVFPTISQPTSGPQLPDQRQKVQRRHGYTVKPQVPSYKPYSLNSRGRPSKKVFPCGPVEDLKRRSPLSSDQWNAMAVEAGILDVDSQLRQYQIDAANFIIGRSGDLVVVTPTGMGKSLTWDLPLLVQPGGVSLVLVPYTTLGFQGEEIHKKTSLPAVYISSATKSEDLLESAGTGEFRVIFCCVEMVETPTFMRILSSDYIKAKLSAVYIDESHSIHEQSSWRPSFLRLHQLRQILGNDAPLVCISATQPERYRKSLVLYAGLKPDYKLINLGNFRPELSVVVLNMQHDGTSFLDLAFTLREGTRAEDIEETLVYTDNIDRLTSMYWWYCQRLASMGLPTHLVDILHAGLSEEHHKLSIKDFLSGKTKILLGTDKIGAGVDFPRVRWVIQYQCRGLTLVRWEQRRGRGGRRTGDVSTGVILVEPAMAFGGELSVSKPGFEDPALLDLIHAPFAPPPLRKCCDVITDKWLENPLRVATLPRPNGCCSTCFPSLIPGTEYRWVTYDHPKAQAPRLLSTEKEHLYTSLVVWRDAMWRSDGWREKWPNYGPLDILPNCDLEDLARNAPIIATESELVTRLHTIHALELGPSLFQKLTLLLAEINFGSAQLDESEDEDFPELPVALEALNTRQPNLKRKRTPATPRLSQYETLIRF